MGSEHYYWEKNVLLHNLKKNYQYPTYFCPLFQMSL